ncbi:MAG: hypothetical protein BMS9Abin37_1569 [Acidobacteriota bacterium]|nr:MAG: hypothetical protein BMS9Abin37_1569 [Acidobacteriota bacterium]
MNVFVSALVVLTFSGAALADERVDRLSEKYRDWLEKDVVYIIADKEREAFLNLEFEKERDAFIAAFWRRRDPDPVTPVNEFKQEHYRRLEFVNKYFSRESAVPGWMTDRGKIYIILGEPRDREDFTAVPMLYPTEVWFYEQDREKALPPLNLLFWQEYAVGPYRLFNHFLDDPEDLMPAQPMNRENSRAEAYINLQEINPSLAHAAITMRADQGAAAGIVQPDRAGLDFQGLLSDIYVSPFRRVDTRYVDEADAAKGLVESDYLFNYVPSSGMANVLPGPGGTSFVHYTIEIEARHMTLANDPDKRIYYTSFELRGEVTTADEGTVVYSFTKKPYVQLTEAQFRDVGYRAFAYRDMFPLTEGAFRMRVVLQNQARSEYTIFESDLAVPARSETDPFLGPPVPLYGMARMKGPDRDAPEPYRTYQIGAVSLDPNAKRTVAIGNYLMALVPVENVPPGSTLEASVHVRDPAGAGDVVTEQRYNLDLYQRPVVIRLPLGDAPGGRYRLNVELVDDGGKSLGTEGVDFDISPRAEIHRPWVARESIDGKNEGLVSAMLAAQAMRLGRTDQGRALGERALRVDPNSVPARLLLGRLHLDEGRFQDAVRLLEPARAQAPQNPEVLLALGDAHLQGKHFRRAVELFETAAAVRRPDAALLNALGFSLRELGETERAIGYLESSLELSPDQPKTRALLQELRSRTTP